MYYVFSTELMYFTDILHKNKKICQLISGESLNLNLNLNFKTLTLTLTLKTLTFEGEIWMSRILVLFFAMLIPTILFADESPISVLSFNVRLSTAKDGENSWANRKNYLLEVVQKSPEQNLAYDFIGTQETVIDPREEFNQVLFITSKLSAEYDSIWLSREKTPERGEAMLLLWRKERWRIDAADKGTFWLSDTPDVAGSKTDAKAGCPRIVTYGLFHELKNGKETGKKIYVANTHYDHLSEEARQNAAKQVLNWIANRKEQNTPLIIMGDLNCGEKSPTIQYMKGNKVKLDGIELKPPVALVDTFRETNPDTTDVGTFNGFRENVNNEKIDYIFSTKNLKTISAKIIRKKHNGRWYSDHCPVEAVLTWVENENKTSTNRRQEKTNELRVLTYNIHCGIGMDGRFDLERIAKIILDQKADLVAIQEVDRFRRRSQNCDEPSELARLTGMNIVFGKALQFGNEEEYGVAILSRFPILQHKINQLPEHAKEENRVALEALIRIDEGVELTFVSTHFCHRVAERRVRQAEKINELFAKENQFVILAGDINATPENQAVTTLYQKWIDTTNKNPTCPTTNPSIKIDYIFYRPQGKLKVKETKVIEEKVASDHFPVLTLFQF
jgi:endonuclease/exonuclease/phosphatase family metal-dependent hydrolase